MKTINPSKQFLNECFLYKDGQLFWKKRPVHHFSTAKACNIFNALYKHKKAGSILSAQRSNTKYIAVKINGKSYKLHRLVYIYHYGDIETNHVIDHIDRNGLNNNILNLRVVSESYNQKNKDLQKSNKTGVSGVNWHKSAKKWQVRAVDTNGKRVDLGRYDSFEHAVSIRKKFEKENGYLL